MNLARAHLGVVCNFWERQLPMVNQTLADFLNRFTKVREDELACQLPPKLCRHLVAVPGRSSS
jgi:hypothetical protein